MVLSAGTAAWVYGCGEIPKCPCGMVGKLCIAFFSDCRGWCMGLFLLLIWLATGAGALVAMFLLPYYFMVWVFAICWQACNEGKRSEDFIFHDQLSCDPDTKMFKAIWWLGVGLSYGNFIGSFVMMCYTSKIVSEQPKIEVEADFRSLCVSMVLSGLNIFLTSLDMLSRCRSIRVGLAWNEHRLDDLMDKLPLWARQSMKVYPEHIKSPSDDGSARSSDDGSDNGSDSQASGSLGSQMVPPKAADEVMDRSSGRSSRGSEGSSNRGSGGGSRVSGASNKGSCDEQGPSGNEDATVLPERLVETCSGSRESAQNTPESTDIAAAVSAALHNNGPSPTTGGSH